MFQLTHHGEWIRFSFLEYQYKHIRLASQEKAGDNSLGLFQGFLSNEPFSRRVFLIVSMLFILKLVRFKLNSALGLSRISFRTETQRPTAKKLTILPASRIFERIPALD